MEVYENGTRQQTVVKEAEGTLERIESLGQSVTQIIDKKMSIAKKTIHRKIATIEMKIIVDDEKKPVRIIRFYANLDKRLKKESTDHLAIQRQIDHWVSLLTFIMDNRRKLLKLLPVLSGRQLFPCHVKNHVEIPLTHIVE